MNTRRALSAIGFAASLALPGLLSRAVGAHLPPPIVAAISGAAIMGAAFLLLWACDAAQADISQALAIAIVALIAVMPEYAVDMYFTWQAGRNPGSEYAHYAIANMTGANRLLIGVAWVSIAVIFWVRTRRSVYIGVARRTELAYLGLATAWAFVIALKGSLTLLDGAVLIGIYVAYIRLAARRGCEEVDARGPAQWLVSLPTRARRLSVGAIFVFAAVVIVTNAESFSEGLVGTGTLLKIDKFLLVQWLAPIASEAPEFIVAIMFAWRGEAGLALGSLICAKLNQWTLLVGMIPGAYALAHGSTAHPIPMGSLQMHEIWLTAAQSLLGIVVLAQLRLTIGQAMLLLALFVGQFVTPALVAMFPGRFLWPMTGDQVHQMFTVLYLVSAASLWADRPQRVWELRHGLYIAPDQAPPTG